jgi:zinc transport system ATP-binding protein
VKADPIPDPGLELPEPWTLCLYTGSERLFASERHWLHPLFELEAYFARSGQDPRQTRVVDRVTGRAAAFLLVRLGIPELHTLVLSRRAIPVLARHAIQCRFREQVDRIGCATEDLLAQTEDPGAAWSILQERRAGGSLRTNQSPSEANRRST